jgi:hypothetical protein
MLNGLVISGLSERDVADGIKCGKYLPSDFLDTGDGTWVHIKDSGLCRKTFAKFNGWMALFIISFILNILTLLMLFWQNSRIENLLK